MTDSQIAELQNYFLTNFTSCPPTPFLESYGFFKASMNILTGPLIFLGVYGIVVILVATPKEIKNAKWVVMNFQVTSLWLGSLACFLERPYIHYPSSARYDTGLFLLLGMSFRLASIFGQSAYSIQGISRVMLFESRYNQMCTNPNRKMSSKFRVIFYIFHYSLFLFLYIYHLSPDVEDVTARLKILKYIPCPEPTFFKKETEVMTMDMTLQFQLSCFQSVYLFSLAYFFAILSGYCLWKTSSGISEKTRKMQKKFLLALVIQSVIPFFVLFIPSLFYWTLSAVGDEYSDSSSCTPKSPRLFLFTYSNDFDAEQFKYVLGAITNDPSDKFTVLGNLRFDLKQPEDAQFHSDWNSWNNSIYEHLPNPAVGFSNNSTGSDILNVIDKFLDTTEVPICGCVIHVASMRFPNEKNIDSLVAKVRENNCVVRTIMPMNSSGGLYYETLYNLATRTNGLGFFALNYGRYYIAVQDMFTMDWDPYQVYAVNVNVSGSGVMTLPDMYLPAYTYYNFYVTLQDNGVLSTFQSMSLNITSPYDSYSYFAARCKNYLSDGLNFADTLQHLFTGGTYKTTLEYIYSDSRTQTLQIRVRSTDKIDFWIPYVN